MNKSLIFMSMSAVLCASLSFSAFAGNGVHQTPVPEVQGKQQPSLKDDQKLDERAIWESAENWHFNSSPLNKTKPKAGGPQRFVGWSNVELKARDPEPERSLALCRHLGAHDEGTLWQRDTYYAVANGRLKLREQQPGCAHLIAYARANRPEQRESRYRLVEVADAAALDAALADALGVECVVTKRRRLLRWRSVRIHLDAVEQLGTFVELEAVAPADSDLTVERELIAALRQELGITDERLVARGYADQIREQ